MSWSPDSRWLVFRNEEHAVDGQPEYGLVDLQSQSKKYVKLGNSSFAETERPEAQAYWSPDSTRVALDDSKKFYDPESKKLLFTPATDSLNNRISWSKGSSYALIFTYGDYRDLDQAKKTSLQIVDRDGKLVRVVQENTDTSFPLLLWLDDTEFLRLDESGALSVEDALGKGNCTLTLPKKVQISDLFLSAKGDELYLYGESTIYKVTLVRE